MLSSLPIWLLLSLHGMCNNLAVLASNATLAAINSSSFATTSATIHVAPNLKLHSPTTVKGTFTLTTAAVLVLPEGSDSAGDQVKSIFSVNGPTTVTAVLVTDAYDEPRTYPLNYFTTATFILEEGTLQFNAAEGTNYSVVTLVGPTTATITASQPGGDFDVAFEAYDNTADTACHGTFTSNSWYSAFLIDHLVIRKSPVAKLAVGQTLTIQVVEGGGSLSFTTVNRTFSGPSTVYTTRTDQLVAPQFQGGPFYTPAHPPGQRCGGGCGSCMVFFPVVYVHYWPVEQPNTACLNVSHDPYTAIAIGNSSGPGMTVRPRGLSKLTAGATTLVSGDFTFTSPSVYIAFPSINAADECGYIGSVHTSVTLAFAPDQLSTAIFLSDWVTTYLPFNYADAECPPLSLSTINAWTPLGLAGYYNPVISPPASLTLLDPKWNQDCIVAPFQGNDPPIALVPAANLVPSTTGVDPVAAATSANPIASVPLVPVQTINTKSPVWTSSSQTALTKTQRSNPLVVSNRPVSGSPISVLISSPEPTLDPISPTVPAVPASPLPRITQTNEEPNDPGATASKSASDPLTVKVTVAGQTHTADSASELSITSHSPAPGAVAIVVGTLIPIPQHPASTPEEITIAGRTYTANSLSNFVINDQTYTPGAAITVTGTLTTIPQPTAVTNPPNKVVIAGQTYTANAESNFIIDSRTFPPGAIITISGTPVALPLQPKATISEAFAFAGHTYTANSASDFLVGGQTLTPGGIVSVSGTRISLAAPSSQIDGLGGSSTQGLGGIIMGGFGTPSGGGNGSGVGVYTGCAARVELGRRAMAGVGGLWMLILRMW